MNFPNNITPVEQLPPSLGDPKPGEIYVTYIVGGDTPGVSYTGVLVDECFGGYTTNISLNHLSQDAKNVYIAQDIDTDEKLKNSLLTDTGINTSFAIDAANKFVDCHSGAPLIGELQNQLDSGKNIDLWYELPQWYKANNLRLNAQYYIIKVTRPAGNLATYTYTKTHPLQ